jgi:Bacterial Ig-like domain (group 3)/FG-GAP-like repeat
METLMSKKSVLRLVCFAFMLSLASASFGAEKLFKPFQTYNPGAEGPSWTAVADVNGDGKADLLVINSCSNGDNCNGSDSIGVLLGNGDGTFQTAQIYDAGGTDPISILAADVNGDGKIDLIVVNDCADTGETCQFSSAGQVGVLLGNGDGTFQPVQLYNTGGFGPTALAVADINGDGKPDVIVTRTDSECWGQLGFVDVLLGNGDGTFQPVQTYTSGGCGSNSIAVADVNGDGRLDLVIGNLCGFDNCEGLVSVLLGNGDGTFLAPQNYLSGNDYASAVAVADVNEDGKLDILVTNECLNCDSGGTVGVLLGNGDGTFQAAQLYGSGGYVALQVTVGDVNQDGHSDILVMNCGLKEPSCVKRHAQIGKGEVGVLLGNGDGTFQAAQSYASGGASARAIAIADLNGDGKLDVVTTNLCGMPETLCKGGNIGVLLNVAPWNTTTVLASSPNPSIAGELVTFTATVGTAGGAAPTGVVKFENGGALLGSAMLSNGVAVLKKRNLPVGSLSITANYKGDVESAGSTSQVLIQVVNSAGQKP